MSTLAVDARKVAAMRLVLAASGLLIIWLDPLQPDRFPILTYSALSIYTVYSALLYILSLRRQTLLIDHWAHWLDVFSYSVLITINNGTNSIFFFGYFLAILTASFRWGFGPGLRTTLVSAAAFTVVGLIYVALLRFPRAAIFELDRFMLRLVYLPVIGYMMAYWGGKEIALKRRLELLKEVSTLANPRFGVDRTIAVLLERLSAFYDGDLCTLVIESSVPGAYLIYRHGAGSQTGGRPDALNAEMADLLLALPVEQVVVFNRHRVWWQWRPGPACLTFHAANFERLEMNGAICERLGTFFGTNAYATVPLRHVGASGRLYLASGKRAYNAEDANFLLQVVEHVTPIIYSVRLVDRMASDAAEAERQKIARDIHDSVIQPYIGLQMALGATQAKLVAQGNSGAAELDALLDMASAGVAEMRGFVQELTGERDRQPSLMPAVRRFADKFTEATGITVDLAASDRMYLNDRLAAEVFQIIAEGLSNIRKHTSADQARIAVAEQQGQLYLRIENDDESNGASGPFVPRSITGRATALGGHARVERAFDRKTAVIVEIPL